MSRGYWDYRNESLKSDIFGWDDEKPKNVFEDEEISEIIFDMFDLLYAFDSYKSGDWCEKSWIKEKNKFKKKWFKTPREDICKKIIDRRIEELKTEMYETFELESEE